MLFQMTKEGLAMESFDGGLQGAFVLENRQHPAADLHTIFGTWCS